MSQEQDALPTQTESQIESSTEEIVIRIPNPTRATTLSLTLTPNGTSPSMPGLDSGTVLSLVDRILQKVRNLNLTSYRNAALDDDYSKEPVMVALTLMQNEIIRELWEVRNLVDQSGHLGGDSGAVHAGYHLDPPPDRSVDEPS